MRILPYGEHAVLVELDTLEQVHALHALALAHHVCIDSVPGWRSLLLSGGGTTEELADRVRVLQADIATGGSSQPTRTCHEVEVVYDGEDLHAVAEATGMSVAEVITLHSSAVYTVAFVGFARAFPYLAGLPTQLELPRRATPRTRVPAGSVAIARDQCGIYPAETPGGWHLLGRTSATFFDPSREPPTPLQPGDEIRFTATAP